MSLRLDRAGSLYCVGPLFRVFSGRDGKIPILMYHSVADEDESALGPYFRIALSPALFLQQMSWLHEHGYRTASLASAVKQLEAGGATAEKTVVITFDDGYRNFYQHAWPALERFRFTATMFLPAASIGDQPQIFNKRECMTWGEVRELQKQGISFGSHTVTHPQLHDLQPDRIREEILQSRQTIEDKTGSPVDTFAYPYAFPQTDGPFIAMLRQILEEGGYRFGVCTRIGRAGKASDPLFLERLPVNSADDAAFFAAKMAGAYDWVGGMQSLAKRVRKARTKAWTQK
ncbi:MAG TPA: polysaccharide deacetylase family protein [Acidobacteriaceae bacterium]|nr:polysaccharide deacetylase family protein [Acidobacteriaceae bacterium]